jgi:hypothetical protein
MCRIRYTVRRGGLQEPIQGEMKIRIVIELGQEAHHRDKRGLRRHGIGAQNARWNSGMLQLGLTARSTMSRILVGP